MTKIESEAEVESEEDKRTNMLIEKHMQSGCSTCRGYLHYINYTNQLKDKRLKPVVFASLMKHIYSSLQVKK
jgi:predicted anti-sigma-YlaC factor YlaD